MVKCIAIDMDGTLLTSSQEVTKANRQAIHLAQQKGVEVVIATGRAYEESGDLLKSAGIITPMICANGAEIRTKDHEIVDTNPLNKDIASEVSEILHSYNVYYEIYTNKGTYTVDKEKARALIIDIFTVNGEASQSEEILKAAEERLNQIHHVDSYGQLFADSSQVVYKLLAFHFDSIVLDKVREELKKKSELAISASGKDNIEITSVYAQKGVALEKFVSAHTIDLADAMAIGDNFNDVSMFKKAGRAVAMGNAVEEIKNQCDFVTGTNEESGVAQAILQVLDK